MKIHDISLPIYEGMPVYKNKPEKQPEFTVTQDHTTGKVRESRVALDVHGGTHVDAPLHMIPEGETIETISLEELVGDVRVLDVTNVTGGIEAEDLKPFNIQAGETILLKTKNSFDDAFNFEFIFLAESGATLLAEIGIKTVGIDALGIERSQPEHPTHKTLFQKGIIIIEGLALQDIAEGSYKMVAAPLKLRGLDAAPARVLLIEE